MTEDNFPTDRTLSAMKVEVVRTREGYRLLRGGEPYAIKGAGMALDDVGRLAAHGGNSIRNWTTGDRPQDIRRMLDRAHAHGVTVALCLPMRPERRGFDYDDAAAVASQLEALRRDVLRFRDHPALLFWIIGNELNHHYTNPKVFDAVNEAAEMIHELDPNHPATMALSGLVEDVILQVQDRAPTLDFLSFQLYGELRALPGSIRKIGFTAPFMVTEWGTIGWWETETTPWGAPVELTSTERADFVLRTHREALEALDGQLIGSYVFMWGHKQERTPTWFGLLTETGEETESVDVMHYIWNGTWPANRTPRVDAMRLDGRGAREGVTLVRGRTYTAGFEVRDPEGGPLRYRWEVKPESAATQVGGDFEEPIPGIEGWLAEPGAARTSITVREPGRYRLFASACDADGHAAHANIPFLVRPPGDR